MTRVAPGRTRRTASLGPTSGPRSSALTTTRSARVRSGRVIGARRSTSLPASSVRSRPCQPRPTSGTRADPPVAEGDGSPRTAHESSSSPATGARTRASNADVHARGSAVSGTRSDVEMQRWRRPAGASMFSNAGPDLSSARVRTTPASRSRSSSVALAASRSTPTSAHTSMPSRASESEAWVTAPPSRQPRESATVTSREAAPTTSAIGRSTGSSMGMPYSGGPPQRTSGARRVVFL